MTGTFLGGARPITLPWWGYALLAAVLVASPFLVSDYMAGIGTRGHLRHCRRGSDAHLRLCGPDHSRFGRVPRHRFLHFGPAHHTAALAVPIGSAVRRDRRRRVLLRPDIPRVEAFRALCRHSHNRPWCRDGGAHPHCRTAHARLVGYSGHPVAHGVRRGARHPRRRSTCSTSSCSLWRW